ncbi:BspA family leucine-rich repeat surface protein [Bifidobacterium sp. ESL0775]|uniref:BspA family leucine-rich repeat surface protein n=1 Tax=Bifidobacterium sp. ESL0775 TaxID=2983230 RepID=UPI0023F90500|nr:BspA family leucine-rich repeat surface protein [Bifidobacterium sp. ESL0775]WEV69422.1 BspA family leucine-rich repeat surface protein [Bifidobacterium sp. ESL0775]
MHNNDDFDPPPQAGHQNPLTQPGKTPTSSQTTPSRRDTDASTAAHPTKSAVAHSNPPSKPNAPSAPDAARSRTTPSPSTKAQPGKTSKVDKTGGIPSTPPTIQADAAVTPLPTTQSDDEATPQLRIQTATLPTTQSPVLAKTTDTALTTTETTTGPQADPDTDGTTGQTQDAIPQVPADTSGSGLRSAAAGAASGRRTRRGNAAAGADPAGASGAVRAAADHDGAQAGTPQAQGELEAGPQDTCPATTPAAWGTSNVTWNIDSTCTLHLSGGTYTDGWGTIPWDSLKTTITTIHIDGDLTLDGYSLGTFKGMTSLRSVAPGATVHLKNGAADSMFEGDTSLASADLSNWDTSGAIYMDFMFEGCSSLTTEGLKLFQLDVGNNKHLMMMFEGCSSLTSLDLSHWNVANVLSTAMMFNACTRLTSLNVSNWSKDGVIYMFLARESNKLPWSMPPLVTLDMHNVDTGCPAGATSGIECNSHDFEDCFQIPSTVRKLGLGPRTILPSDKTSGIAAATKWYKTSDFNETDTDCLGRYPTADDFQRQLASSDPSGFYMADPYVHNLSHVNIDPNGGTTSVASYTVDTHTRDSGVFTVSVPSGILTNPAGKLFDGWTYGPSNQYQFAAASSTSWNFTSHARDTLTLKAKWRTPPATSLSFINVPQRLMPDGGPSGPVKFTVQDAAAAGYETIGVTTGRGGSASCSVSASTRYCSVTIPAASVEPTPGVQYTATAATTTTDPYTGQRVATGSATQRGHLAYEHLTFSRGTGTGTPPQDIKALMYSYRTGGTTYNQASVTIPNQQGLTGPGGDTYLDYWTYTNSVIGYQTIAPGPYDYVIGDDAGDGVARATLTPHWQAVGPARFDGATVHARPGDAPTADLSYDMVSNIGVFVDGLTARLDLDTHRADGTDTCAPTASATDCQATGWPAGRLTDTARGAAARYQYRVTVTLTVTNPTTGQRIAKSTDQTGTLASMRATFARGTTPGGPVTGDEPAITDDILADTTTYPATAAIPVPARGNLRGPNAWFAGWAGPARTWQPGTQAVPLTEATSLDGGAHYTLALAAKWDTMANPSIDDPTVMAPAGIAPTFSMGASTGWNAPSGWSMSVTSSTTGTTLLSCTQATASIPRYCNTATFRPVPDLTSTAPGSAYTVTATVTAPNPDDPSDTLTATATKNSVLPYLTLRYANGGGTGTLPAGAQALIDNSGGSSETSKKAYPDIADPTGLTGPSGAAFTGWQAGGRTWQPGPAQMVPKTAGVAGGTGETVVTLTATWSTVAKPTNLAAAYHHNGDTVTLSGSAMGVGGDTVTACMTDGAGETDTCQTSQPNPRTAPEPTPGGEFTPASGGNPRVETFSVDPADVGSIAITGHIDRDTTFTNPGTTTAHVRVCPAGTPAPATGAVPSDCTDILTYIRSGATTGANDNAPWHGRFMPRPMDQDHTTNDASFKNGDGYYDIWAYAAAGPNRTNISQMGTPVKVYSRYHYTATPPAAPTTASWDWSVSFPAADYIDRYGAGGQHHFTARQTSQGADGGSQDLQGVLPWLKTTYQPDMPGGTSATAPDPGASLVDTSDTSRPSDLTLARPTDSMEPPDAVFLGWSATAGATTPDTGMGDPSNRTVTLSAPAGSPEADTTLHAVWRTLNQPAVDATTSRDPVSKDVTLTGNATPWTSDETVEATATGLDGQTGTSVGTPQAPTLDTAGAYDGSTRHGWTLTLPGTGIPQGGRYRVSASAVGDDGAWRGAAHRYAKATTTRDVTIPAGATILRALPLTGGPARRLATLLALLLGATLLLLAAATRLRDKRREQPQGQGCTR